MPPPSALRSRQPNEPKHVPARHEEVLETALNLIAERGVAGASLRTLAKQLGMSQPSLYHYFRSKQDLVSQIVEYCTDKMLQVPPPERPLNRVEELPRFVMEVVSELWATERHPKFVRFMFVVAIESPEHRDVIRRTFEDRLYPGFSAIAGAFSCNEEERRELQGIVWMIVYSLSLALMERRALFYSTGHEPEIADQAEWIVAAAETLLRERVLAKRAR